MKTWVPSILIIVTVVLVGSFISNMVMTHHHDSHKSVFNTIESKPYYPDSIKVSSVKHLASLDTVGVDIDGRHFAILNRENQITSFACSECHNEPLAELKNERQKAGKKSHWNIEMQHAPSKIMNCTSCHSEGNMDELHSITGEAISFNRSDQLCSQCHQQEHKDWVGGAHGKRVGGWAKPVVKNACTNCHNPHKPGFPHKYPSRINSRMIEQRAKK